MFASLIRQWWGRRPAPVSGQMEYLSPDDLPEISDSRLKLPVAQAVALANQGQWEAAIRRLKKICAGEARFALPHALLGAVLEQRGEIELAALAFERARQADGGLLLDQTVGEHFHLRGRAYLRERKPGEAVRCLLLAHRLLPTMVGPLEMLGIAGYQSGDVVAGRRWMDLAITHANADERGPLRVNRLVFTIPQMYGSLAELEATRTRFERELAELRANPPSLTDVTRAVDATLFYLCFQGKNDRQVNADFANLLQRSCPGLDYVAKHVTGRQDRAGSKPRIGFISAFLREHSVGAWYRELIRLLIESGRFETVLFTEGEVDEALRQSAVRDGKHIVLASTVEEARAQIQAERLDMLVYTDVALSRFLYCLAFSRLAPAQALLVGHPCTSGIPAMDYFISNVYQDEEGAQEHYSEQLVRLPKIPVYVRKTPFPARRLSRPELGLDADRRYYICPMLLQKLHPDFDDALAKILRADAKGEIVLFEDPKKSHWREELEARFSRQMPDVAARITFQPLAPTEVFLNLLLSADCLLDPFHFSGGVTTYIELSLGLPVVSLPGELFRSRMTAGIYAQAGVSDCIARDPGHYVELALSLAADPERRAGISRNILDAHKNIFETRDAVDGFADWMERTVMEKYRC